MNTQQTGSLVRQVMAVAALVMGGLTAALPSIALPPGVSGVLAAVGGLVLAVEHYVSDPSTGSTSSAPMPPQPPTA